MTRTVGLLTGGGDAPGLNAVIRAFVKTCVKHYGIRVIGLEDAYNGLMEVPPRVRELDLAAVSGLLSKGGTILGTTNRGDPFSMPGPDGVMVDRTAHLVDMVNRLGLEGIVTIGGDGSQAIGYRLMTDHGVPSIGVPKTIDNDLNATDYTFGFQSAVDIATEALDRLHTTAESHDRVLVLEVMGRDAGHIALHAGISGGADAVLIPEIPWNPTRVAEKIANRYATGRSFAVIIVAEGAVPAGVDAADNQAKWRLIRARGGAAAIVEQELTSRVDAEIRTCVLGHTQRGGSPVPVDRLLATRFGVAAADLVAQGRWGEMVRLRDGVVDGVPLAEAIALNRGVDPNGELVRAARLVGMEFGA